MIQTHSDAGGGGPPAEAAGGIRVLERAIEHASHLLPAQGPIGVFIHHNTLHAFQHLSFEEAVSQAAGLFGAEPYMAESAYREAMARGRIRIEDIDSVLESEPDGELWAGGLTRRALLGAMLKNPLHDFRPETIDWELSDGILAEQGETELFRLCLSATPEKLDSAGDRVVRPRDGILAAGGPDIDEPIHSVLIKLTAAFVDQGVAYWPMPGREQGLWRASLAILAQPPGLEAQALHRLAEFARKARGWNSAEAACRFLEMLGVAESDWPELIEAELLALPGWPGLVRQLEMDPALAPHERVPASLRDFLALRLLLTVAAVASVRGRAGVWRYSGTDTDHRAERLARSARFFEAVRAAGLSADALRRLDHGSLAGLFRTVENFGSLERRRLLHLAYERRHERQILIPLARHRELPAVRQPAARPAAHVFFCIDEREESIRRHLEETDPEIETLGAAGFFGVAMNYTGIDDAHGVSLCPVVVKPRHAVTERVSEGHAEAHQRRQARRRLWARVVYNWSVSSRTLIRGWLGTAGLGLFSLFPMAGRVLDPRRYALLVKWLEAGMLPEPRTELAFMRAGEAGRQPIEGLLAGFTLEEKADRVAAMLGAAGLRGGMARLVVVLGHGSTSLNNPHESAHDCGACGGRRGGPNGRLFAAMANHPGVRQLLASRGVVIAEDTWFVGGYHDTCNDDVDLYDLEAVPASHRAELARVRASLDRARALSAHERARRFEAAPWSIDATGGLHHVQARAEHLAEPRPEYGHCTNSVCIVGRRSTTRGLFFDRRAFLVSYDASQDPADQSLAAILGAVIPVCGGISLEYYFSFVDNEVYGCGTKLPHNVTGLVGVMNGYESDLRTGLPWQMVEIHEPVRILFVVETTPERVLAVIRNNPLLWEFLSNRWIRLAVADPAGGPMLAYREGAWEPVEGGDETLPAAPSSQAWYRGRREHLPVARIGA